MPEADLYIYEEIDKDFGIGADAFVKKLNGLGRTELVNVHINSPGGSVFEAITIVNALRQYRTKHSATIATYVDGLAASAASVIAMAGDKRVMADNSLMMVHQPLAFAYGNAKEFRDLAELLDKVSNDTIVPTYAAATGLEREKITELLDGETWLSATEAKELGFATEIAEAKPLKNVLLPKFLDHYRNVPKAFLDALNAAGGQKTGKVAEGQGEPKEKTDEVQEKPDLTAYQNDLRLWELIGA